MPSTPTFRVAFGGLALSYVCLQKLTRHQPPHIKTLLPLLSDAFKTVAKTLVTPFSTSYSSPIAATLTTISEYYLGEPDSLQRSINPVLLFSITVISAVSFVSIAVRVKKKVWKLLNKPPSPLPIRKIQLSTIYASAIAALYDAVVCCTQRPAINTLAIALISGGLVAAPSMWWSRDQGIEDKAGLSLLVYCGVCTAATFGTMGVSLLPQHSFAARTSLSIATFTVFLVLRGLENLTGTYFVTPVVKRIYLNTIEPVCVFIDSVVCKTLNLFQVGIRKTCSFILTHLIVPIFNAAKKMFSLTHTYFISPIFKAAKKTCSYVLTHLISPILNAAKKTCSYVLTHLINPICNAAKMTRNKVLELTQIAASDLQTHLLSPLHERCLKPLKLFLLESLIRLISGSARTAKKIGAVTHKHFLSPIFKAFKHVTRATLNLINVRLLTPLLKITKQLIIASHKHTLRFIKSTIYPLVTPFAALVASYEFGRNGLTHLQKSDTDIVSVFVFSFASITTGAVAMVLLGRRCRTRADWLARRNYKLLSRGLNNLASLFEITGVVVYSHSDLGILDFISYALRKMYPAARSAAALLANYVRYLSSTIYFAVCLLVTNVSTAIWTAASYLAKVTKKVLKVIFKTVKKTLVQVWRNPFLCLLLNAFIITSAIYLKNHHPDFSIAQHANDVRVDFCRRLNTEMRWIIRVINLPLDSFTRTYLLLKSSRTFSALQQLGTALNSLHSKADALDFWRWFGSRTFAGVTAISHLTVSRVMRSITPVNTHAHGNPLATWDEKTIIVASFGRLNTKLIIVPVLALSGIKIPLVSTFLLSSWMFTR
ncbi:hypothetical protein TrVE_jg11862 [Triparma verrucosa]|uniref:Uncharacterized protein n=1 Tax=Triparma verrucosa TaxID=1606542 RepID=A0A9W7F7D5_9STRA|nr:hypothetical protein TrVE_jg11862 [Triparma verrucosa]